MAQTGPSARPSVPPAAAGFAPAAPAPYEDRVIQGFTAIEEEEDIAQRKYDNSGLPRGYSLEALSDLRLTQGQQSSALGLKASGYAETLHYGSLSGSLTLQNQEINQSGGSSQRTQASSIVLRQIGMPFDGGWRADNALGMINLPSLDLARKSPRVSVPTPAMQGLTSQWKQGPDFGLVAGVGQPGRFAGFPVTAFSVSQGQYTMVAAHDQIRAADASWSWGTMVAQAQGVPSVLAITPNGQGLLDAQGLYLAARRESGSLGSETYLQFNAMAGNNTGTDLQGNRNPAANGLWFDGGFGTGLYRHSWGLFRLDPGLAWLDLPMASDLQGGYWRLNRRTRQWQNESALELFNSVTGTTPAGYFFSDNLRYQYSTSTSFGSTVTVRRYGTQAQSVLFYSQFANDYGSSRAQVELASADTGERQVQFKLDHDWALNSDLRLSTSVLVDRDQRLTGETQGRGFAVNADQAIGNNMSLTTSFQGRWATDQTQYTLNGGMNWRIAPQWSLQSTVYAIQGTSGAISLAQSPLTPPVIATNPVQDSGISIVLRFDESAGRPRAPVGGLPGSAAGNLAGSVYLDENQNGKRDAFELGAANVTVVLDGRYSTQTDARGHFDFAYVVAGNHVLNVSSDNLPLPWGLQKDGRAEVRVFTRDTTVVDIGAVKF